MNSAERMEDEQLSPIFTISVGQTFKPYAWKASHDMDFHAECLYCESEVLKGYIVEDEFGRSGRIAACPTCDKVNAKY
jgi:hypothetical protein